MHVLFSLAAVLGLVALAYAGALANLQVLFGVVIPYLAVAGFLVGVAYRIMKWARSPVPFRIPTTCGQQSSLAWIKGDTLDNPSCTVGVLGRMALEVLFFRSLFRNTKSDIVDQKTLTFGPTKWLWGAALIFHWSFLVILVRHLRFFAEPVPCLITLASDLDGFFQVGLPILYLTDLAILVGLTYLFVRRVVIPQIRYISLASDYFPLFLILGVAISGVLMRYFYKVDVVAVKALTMGLLTFSPPELSGIGPIFYVHLFLVSALLLYFPFSKLMHMGGVFLSPTRNLANNNRVMRHINPWNPEVKKHHYWEWQEEFKDKIEAAGLPLDTEIKKD